MSDQADRCVCSRFLAPIDIPTAATVSFIESYVPIGGAILEVGCGAGHVAAELSRRGYEVVGIDSDEEVVLQARRLDVRAVRASWPAIDVDRVDAVLFTRSLHHISPLTEAVSKALEVLKPGGLLLIDDFAFEEAEPSAIEWFLRVVGSQKGRALIAPKPHEFVTTLMNASDALGAWQQNHDHDLSTAAEITRAIGEAFVIRHAERVPYLYRYLVHVLPESPEATSFIEEVLAEESRLGNARAFSLIGYRIVAVAS